MFGTIDSARLAELLASGSPPRLLDVRTGEEFRRGRLAGAVHIPLNELPARTGELEPGETWVIYCLSGGRSAQACAFLAQRGFTDTHNLADGIAGWSRAGLPMTV